MEVTGSRPSFDDIVYVRACVLLCLSRFYREVGKWKLPECYRECCWKCPRVANKVALYQDESER